MDDEPDSNGNYGRQVECTWVAHAFKNYVEICKYSIYVAKLLNTL